MKTLPTLFSAALFAISLMTSAQDRTTVRASSMEISDHLDLRAVATIFGESKNLEDFEYRLNDPKTRISNLDLNNDNRVDYLRVVESIEENTHLIIVQAVLERDVFQDVATIEVEKDLTNNRLQVQVVGDVFLYGNHYIYEPVYFRTPLIYAHFWAPRYHVYYSPWHWNYYPGFYLTWNPFPYYRYRTHVNLYINTNNTCHYVNQRRSSRAVAMHQTRRANSYERQYPNRSFSARHQSVSNRYELHQTRSTHRSTDRDTRMNSGAKATVAAGTQTQRSRTNSSESTASPRMLVTNSDKTTRSNRAYTPSKESNVSPNASNNRWNAAGQNQRSTTLPSANATRSSKSSSSETRSAPLNSVQQKTPNTTRAVQPSTSPRVSTDRSGAIKSVTPQKSNRQTNQSGRSGARGGVME